MLLQKAPVQDTPAVLVSGCNNVVVVLTPTLLHKQAPLSALLAAEEAEEEEGMKVALCLELAYLGGTDREMDVGASTSPADKKWDESGEADVAD